MKKCGVALAAILSAGLSSCHHINLAQNSPIAGFNYTITESDDCVYFDFTNERYAVSRTLYDLAQTRLDSIDRFIIKNSDLAVRIAPLLDVNGDKKIDFFDVWAIASSKERYNQIVDTVNGYYQEKDSRLTKR